MRPQIIDTIMSRSISGWRWTLAAEKRSSETGKTNEIRTQNNRGKLDGVQLGSLHCADKPKARGRYRSPDGAGGFAAEIAAIRCPCDSAELEPILAPARLHTHRAAGRDCDHRDSRRTAAAGDCCRQTEGEDHQGETGDERS